MIHLLRVAVLIALGAAAALACSSSDATEGGSSSGTIKCALDGERCDCDTRKPELKEEACSPIVVGGGAAICCAEPAFAQSKQGACSCINFSCGLLAGIDCRCGQTDPSLTRVQRCDAPPGRKCCLSPNKQDCSCPVAATGVSSPCVGTEVDICGVDVLSKSCEAHFPEGSQAPVATCRN